MPQRQITAQALFQNGPPELRGIAERIDRLLAPLDLLPIAREEADRAGNPRGMWPVLYPPEGMVNVLPEVYRSHCRELLGRHARGVSLEAATDAELLLAFSEGSLAAPLNTLGFCAYFRVAERILTTREGKTLLARLGPPPAEPYAGAVEELLSTLRRQLRTEGRAPEVPRATTLGAFS